MGARLPVRLAEQRGRLPEHGRIRIGEQVATKSGRSRPSKLDTFRFTSHDRTAIEELAALYGGEVRPWQNGGQTEWEVVSTASEIEVVLPPNPLGDGVVYELWAGGRKRLRRCDGETCEMDAADGEETIERPCICWERQAMECQSKIRLRVLLPRIRLGGCWTLVSSGENAAAELPGMVRLIEEAQTRGMARALLALEMRTSPTDAQKRYAVPVLRMAATYDALTAAPEAVAALPAPAPVAALTAASDGEEAPEDAEIVDLEIERLRAQARRLAREAGLDEAGLDEKVRTLSMGELSGYRQCSTDRLRKLIRSFGGQA